MSHTVTHPAMGIQSQKCIVRGLWCCTNIRVYLHDPTWHKLLHTQATQYSSLLRGYKPVTHKTTQD